ncbi:uncharacterized protein At2g34160-like [Tasmannia lanceolata]|uniref:uncharacterized protein At2g34160-like n=1 Tax=Tasmannia lanceolata TaxID=3420 RepID=UPI004063A7EF
MESHQRNRIQVSNTKKPLFFYVNLAKEVFLVEMMEEKVLDRYLEYDCLVLIFVYLFLGYVFLYGSIVTVVTIAEILKNNGLATEKKILTSTVVCACIL